MTLGELTANKEIEQRLRKMQEHTLHYRKRIALIGLSSSGKSTIFHSLQNVYLDKSLYIDIDKDIIRQYCYKNAINLSLFMNDGQYYEQLETLSVDVVHDRKQIAQIITNIWSSRKMQFLYPQRNMLNLPQGIQIADNLGWYFDKIDEIMSFQYKPTFKDELYCNCYPKSPSTQFHAGRTRRYRWNYFRHQYMFEFLDIPSGFTEKKWKKLYMFEDMHIIVYVADLSRYCKSNEHRKSALEDDIIQYHCILNNKYFRKCDIILLFNKADIFREQLSYGLPFAKFNNPRYTERLQDEERLMELDNRSILEIISVVGYIRLAYDGRDIDLFVPFDVISLTQEYLMDDGDVEDINELYIDALQFIKDLFFSIKDKYEYCEGYQRKIHLYGSCAIDEGIIKQIFWEVESIAVTGFACTDYCCLRSYW